MFRSLLIFAAILLPLRAMAQPITGLYFGGSAGLNITEAMNSAGGTTRINGGLGPSGLAAVGWRFGNGVRVELEGSYRGSSVDGIATKRSNGSQEPLTNVSGGVSTEAVMSNVEYDIPWHLTALPVQPYVGLGIGYAWLGGNGLSGDGVATFPEPQNNSVTSSDVVSFGTGGAFAYQAIAGAALAVSAIQGLDVTFEYRFFGTARANVPVTRVSTDTINGVVPSFVKQNGFEVHDNTLMLGLRYKFSGL